jgi:hypothetical protein
MGVWVELRCDMQNSVGCVSGKNDGPMGMAAPTEVSVRRVYSTMRRRARFEGWIKLDGRLICPSCKLEDEG